MDEITKLREKIDNVDDQIAKLYAERMSLVEDIAEAKKNCKVAVNDPQREQKILDRITETVDGDLKSYLKQVYTTIFETSKAYQKQLVKINSPTRDKLEEVKARGLSAFLGTANLACRKNPKDVVDKFFKNANVSSFDTTSGAFDAVESGSCDYALLEIENSVGVTDFSLYDLIKERGFCIVKGVNLPKCGRFICVSKKFNAFSDANKISLTTILPNVSGSLNSFLSRFSLLGLNVTRLYARPQACDKAQSVLYIDFEGSIENCGVLNLIAELENSAYPFAYLGAYSETTL